MYPFRKLPELPPGDGVAVQTFPPEWATDASAGLVVEFTPQDAPAWIGNFREGQTSLVHLDHHPNGREVVVIAAGEAWIVDPVQRTGRHLCPDAEHAWFAANPTRLVVGTGRAFLCLDANGERWRTPDLTRRPGFEGLRLEIDRVHGKAWADATDTWVPFSINLQSGVVYAADAPIEMPFDFSKVAGPHATAPLTDDGRRQLAVTRNLRRAAFASLLAFPLVVAVLAAINRVARGSTAVFVSGAAWTHVFWSGLFALMPLGVLLAMATLSRTCPRCRNGFFATKGYRRATIGRSSGSVNIFASRCANCDLPLAG